MCLNPLDCRAHGANAYGQRQGHAVSLGGAPSQPQHEVPADEEGLQGLLRTTHAAMSGSSQRFPTIEQSMTQRLPGNYQKIT